MALLVQCYNFDFTIYGFVPVEFPRTFKKWAPGPVIEASALITAVLYAPS